jgi:hypothetical protein
MALEDAQTTRAIHRELVRRYVDLSRVEVRVIHGVCYIRGEMRKLRTHPEIDLDHEAEVIRKLIRQMPQVRDVVWEVYARK